MSHRHGQSLMWIAIAVIAYLALAACNGGGGGGHESTATSTSRAATSSASPSVEQVVSAAYLMSWDVYADAVFNLDETRLEEVLTGAQLQRTREEIERLRQRGRAAKIVVEHDFFVAEVDDGAGTATIRDRYTNNSYEVDAVTKEMVGAAASGVALSDTYFLVREGGAWKVRDGLRQGD